MHDATQIYYSRYAWSTVFFSAEMLLKTAKEQVVPEIINMEQLFDATREHALHIKTSVVNQDINSRVFSFKSMRKLKNRIQI
mmetsp:Transcript_49611/g.98065  ORF Transcript_49611/g.98065 Transcript_49611/m.98065 type:complete len:82 (+) Transcript_49611:747-992(+)